MDKILTVKLSDLSAKTLTESFEYANNIYSMGQVFLKVTDGADVDNYLYMRVEGYDESTDTWFPLGTTYDIKDNVSRNIILGADEFLTEKIKVTIAKNNATAITYSLGLILIDR